MIARTPFPREPVDNLMPTKPLHVKMGAERGTRAFVRNAPASVRRALLPAGLKISPRLSGRFAFIASFVTKTGALPRTFRSLKAHLLPHGKLWVAWPKHDRPDPNLGLAEVIRIGYAHGLVESQCISLDEDWSALKFTFPKPGKIYRNSYGRLRET
jgi:hypothetical protein